jgi:DNA helicase HerA-like ATPase
MNKDAEIAFICGRRGSGKSTKVKDLLRQAKRVVVIDPQNEYHAEGFARFSTWEEIRTSIRRRRGKVFRLALVTADPDQVEKLLRYVLRPLQTGYERHGQKVCLLIEEANLFYHPRQADQRPEITAAILQGRHWGCEIIAVTQRPTLVHPNLRGGARTWSVFALDYDNDRREILSRAGRQYAEELRTLPPHTYLELRDGQVERRTNPPPGSAANDNSGTRRRRRKTG